MLRRRLITVCLLLPLSMAVMASPLLSEGVGERLSIAPLTTSHWHQNAPYNGLCPVVADGNLKTAAGCVAIAAAQIIYYWRDHNPATTTYDTPTYPYGKAPVTYSVPAGTPYEWELMKDSYTDDDSEASRDAVARLVYVIGTSAWLSYGATTGGSIYDVINPLVSQFQMTAQYATKNVFSQEEWEELLYQELANGRPVLYAGTKNGSGHAVVIDGYDATRRLFHFNFGWGGDEDGYYTVDDATGMDGYSQSQKCVYGILPKSIAEDTAMRPATKRQDQALRLSHSGDGCLQVESTEDVAVTICRMDGQVVSRFQVSGREEVRLPRGLYVINGQKWLQ